MKSKILIILSLLFIIIIANGCSFSIKKDEKVVTVNGESIYQSQIDKVVNQSQDHSIKEKDVLEESILRLAIVQEGEKLGITASEEEFEQMLVNYEKNFKDFYDKGLKIYGEKDFFKGLKYNIVYNKTKEYFNQNLSHIMNTEVSDTDLQKFLLDKGITLKLEESNYDIIKNKYLEETRQNEFDIWAVELKNTAEIIYYP